MRASNGNFQSDGCYLFCHNFKCKGNRSGNYHNCGYPEHCHAPCTFSAGCIGIGCPVEKRGSYEVIQKTTRDKSIIRRIDAALKEHYVLGEWYIMHNHCPKWIDENLPGRFEPGCYENISCEQCWNREYKP